MKNILITTIAALGLSLTVAQAGDYTVFKVCQDQRVLKTSDGADAGHVDYIVVDPGSHQVISTVITGGVLAERHIAVPISSLTFGSEREVTLREITRERIVAAPVIETTTFSTSYVVHPDVIERSYTHFGVNVSEINRSSSRTTVEGGPDRVGTRATVGDQTTTERTKTEGRTTTGTNDRTRATTDAPDRTRTSAEKPAGTATTDKPPTTDKPGSTNREGTRATDPTTGKRSGSPEAKTSPDATTKKDGAPTDHASEKSTDQPGKKSDRTPEKAPLKSETSTEKGSAKPEASTEKSPAKPEAGSTKGSSKPEASTDKPAAKPEGGAEKGGTTKRAEKGEPKGEARKAGTTEGSAAVPAGEPKRAQ